MFALLQSLPSFFFFFNMALSSAVLLFFCLSQIYFCLPLLRTYIFGFRVQQSLWHFSSASYPWRFMFESDRRFLVFSLNVYTYYWLFLVLGEYMKTWTSSVILTVNLSTLFQSLIFYICSTPEKDEKNSTLDSLSLHSLFRWYGKLFCATFVWKRNYTLGCIIFSYVS